MRDVSSQRFANNSRHARRLSRLLKLQTNRTMDLLDLMTMDQDFPVKVTHCRDVFFLISIAQWSVEEEDTIMSKVSKGKEKPAPKMEKPQNVLRSKTTNRRIAFKIKIQGNC